jgi:lysophospholipase L1-like esterase
VNPAPSQSFFRRYVALGDSQTEGVGDEPHPDGMPRGWADRFAERLASVEPHLLYANLAVRGKRIAEVHAEQLEPALVLRPDLVSVMAGVNDLIRPRFDLDKALSHMDTMVRQLRSQDVAVLTATFPDPSSVAPIARLIRGRVAAFNAGVRAVAATHAAMLVDLAQSSPGTDSRLWCEDRLHLNPEGHRRLALVIAESVIGPTAQEEPFDVHSAVPSRSGTGGRLQAELQWAHRFLVPWITRRLTGRSSGDGRQAKRPALQPVTP